MKNPINYLKHLWKDPINTIEEADARTLTKPTITNRPHP